MGHRHLRSATTALVITSLVAAGTAGAKPGPAGPPPVIVITEVMTNPSVVLDSRGEWFEVHNPGADAVDLAGWTITDEQSDTHVVGKGLVVPAGGYAVLARVGDPGRNGGIPASYAYGEDLVLLNNPDRLVLLAPDGTEVDRVDWGTAGFPWPRGRSMGLVDPADDNAVGANWCLSTTAMPGGDLGSPLGPTRCDESPHDLVISEILQNPRAVADSVGEWFEVLNRGTTTVDLRGFTIKDDDHDSFTVDASLPVGAGERVVLGRSVTAPVDFAYGDAMALHNSSDELVVLDRDGIQVDRVAWDDGRTFPDPNGASMVLADTESDNGPGGAWCEAAVSWSGADRGTPGEPGGCDQGVAAGLVITEVFVDPVAVGDRSGEWFEVLNATDTTVDLTGWTIRDDDDDRHTITGLSIAPGERAVLAESGTDNGGVEPDYVYGSDLLMHNDADELVLVDERGLVADRVAWSARRGLTPGPGASIELVDPSSDNTLGANWCTATTPFGDGDLGTPGSGSPCPPVPPPPQLVVTEIMRNPAAVGDDHGEWFEVHNPTTDAVDLLGWLISDEDSDLHRIDASVVIPSGGWVVLGRDADRGRNGRVDIAYAYGTDIRLSNTADELVLSDPHGRPVDRIRWDDGDLWLRPNGASMALALATLDRSLPGPLAVGNEPGGWCESAPTFGAGDRGTPGAPTICLTETDPDRIVITEVHRNPAAVADSLGEWIEVYNADDHPVNLNGWVLADADWDRWTIRHTGSLVLKPGEYLVIGKHDDPARNGGLEVEVTYGPAIILFNAADELVLTDRKGRVIDRVVWRSGFPGASGRSAQLRDLAGDGTDPGSWCEGVSIYGDGDRGTPGNPTACGT